ncbi:hypothetical protein GTW66_26330 [Streptomyces sp. SID5473]|uniref:Putative Flp pilus-assembly TadG-like N-terminal domain-containing protein n=1 Tax=Streptomyces tsukubensis (strain DSM 42081 / NBRC 108919 / NRRL 18488 / 9993) TaxID=1114943 RepID=I2N5B6_STRT9|nr:hypothetical protein B7R87_21905 [Streptomyces tsukubensis]EIF92213.1 secreted protein [Streptomyces tsukubensis NRRL18488]MYS67402.1 hypothetical protein [Streptomyces sp. SID5473]QKM67766.1 hypothetical protein STSU_011885 [Streptomyces tsukubensis NRRL18488]TAI44162.1 hypothetical protein EWI31_11680 [Streptomyces tsukubensis]
MVALVLFAALAFFVVGQAGAVRNGTQSAADAAALAAAQESRDRVGDDLWTLPLDPDLLRRIFEGDFTGPSGAACDAAAALAERNKATIERCGALGDGRWGFFVQALSANPVGDTVVPGTGSARARQSATAVVESRCTFDPAPAPSPSPEPPEGPGDPSASPPPGDGEEPPEPPPIGELHCDDGDFTLDPERPDDFPAMSDLFTVRLAEDRP